MNLDFNLSGFFEILFIAIFPCRVAMGLRLRLFDHLGGHFLRPNAPNITWIRLICFANMEDLITSESPVLLQKLFDQLLEKNPHGFFAPFWCFKFPIASYWNTPKPGAFCCSLRTPVLTPGAILKSSHSAPYLWQQPGACRSQQRQHA